MTGRRHLLLLGGAAAVAGAALACSEVSTNPNTVLSLQLVPMQLPSVVLGDSIHDTAGAVDSLHATAYNSKGLPVAGAPIRFLAISGRALVQVDSASGQVVGLATLDTVRDTLGNVVAIRTRALVIASVSGLQTLPDTIYVVERPDSLTPLDSATYSFDYNRGTLRDTTFPLRVQLWHLPADTVPHYRLEYAFTHPLPNTNLDPAKPQLVNAAGVPQLVDTTTVAGGLSTLSLHLSFVADTMTDTVGVDVRAWEPDHTPVPGSPVHFTIHLHIH
ncbi:MAG TPA: hypothetical protein VMT93_06965 [Gemmatimonadaceae bacterium]|nr:hypothetical protein [Gemmatimonadaceae bacterium]